MISDDTRNRVRRRFPRVPLEGEATVLLDGIVRSSKLTDLSPAGVQLTCHRQVVDQISSEKSDAGLYPDIHLEFPLPGDARQQRSIRATCSVFACRRLSQDYYQLALQFRSLEPKAERVIGSYIERAVAA